MPPVITVEANDFAHTVPAGVVTFRLVNHGKETHHAGVEFLDQGARGVFAVDLARGEYGYICFVPDAKDGKRR